MLIRRDDGFHHPVPSEITPPHIYAQRRSFLSGLGAAGLLASGAGAWAQSAAVPRPGKLAPLASSISTVPGAQATENITTYKSASTYNNFYEFGTDKADPAENAHTLKTRPWTVEIEGLVKKPGLLSLEELLKLSAMEERGIRLDVALLEKFGLELDRDIAAGEQAVHAAAGREFNLASPKMLGEVLFDELRIQDAAGVKRPKRTMTGWSTDAETLESNYADVEIVKRVLEWREVSKLKNTYVEALPRFVNPKTGRVHCSFSQVTAATGRLASSDPNLQNIPVRTERGQRLRQAFIARDPDEQGPWILFTADYGQVELRIMAHFAGDARMKAAFAEGRDIHASTASVVFEVDERLVTREMRSRAKAVNFGLLYGMGAARLARETGLTILEAKRFMERYFDSFPKVRGWREQLLATARETGYVETLFGRRRMMPDLRSDNGRLRAFAENMAVNTPIQGSAADIIKKAMIDLESRLAKSGLAAQMLLQVHDELVLELPKKELELVRPMVIDCMQGAASLDVPLAVETGFGQNWLEAH